MQRQQSIHSRQANGFVPIVFRIISKLKSVLLDRNACIISIEQQTVLVRVYFYDVFSRILKMPYNAI